MASSLPIVLGIYGIEATGELLRHLRSIRPAGIHLQRRNIETPEQVYALIATLRQALGYPLLVSVEHEGGPVVPFARGLTCFPGPEALGRADTPGLAYETGRVMGWELSSLGITATLGPILDLAPERYVAGLSSRTFGVAAKTVATLGGEMIRGLQEGGVSAAARRFPGRDPEPFRAAIELGVDLVMPSPDQMYSRDVVTGLLREKLGFRGTVMTEDLADAASRGGRTLEEGVEQLLRAGNDLVLVGSDPELQERAVGALRSMAGFDPARLTGRRSLHHPEQDDGAVIAATVAAGATGVERDPQKLLPVPSGRRVGVILPRFSEAADRYLIDEELREIVSRIRPRVGAGTAVLEVAVQPDAAAVGLTAEWAASQEVVVFFCFDAHRFSGQRRLLEELLRRCSRLVVVAIGNSWDRMWVGDGAALVQTYGFRACQIVAALNVVFEPVLCRRKSGE